jgi:hypothetical protein
VQVSALQLATTVAPIADCLLFEESLVGRCDGCAPGRLDTYPLFLFNMPPADLCILIARLSSGIFEVETQLKRIVQGAQ